MTISIKAWSDFVCPFCMIGEKPLMEAVEASGLDVDIQWMPFELRPYPTPTLRPEDEYLQSVWPQSVYPVAAQYGVELRLPSVSPQPYTALAWEGYQFARERRLGTLYNDRVLKAFFQEDQDIGQIGVLVNLASEIGLDAAAFRAALENRTHRDQHREALDAAQSAGIRAVPTFMIGPRKLSGVQTKETLLAALHELAGR